jgi:hypothetical protein
MTIEDVQIEVAALVTQTTAVLDSATQLRTGVQSDLTAAIAAVVASATSEITANTAKVGVTNEVSSNPTGIVGADAITNMFSLTQAEYDAISTPNASTLYVIVG